LLKHKPKKRLTEVKDFFMVSPYYRMLAANRKLKNRFALSVTTGAIRFQSARPSRRRAVSIVQNIFLISKTIRRMIATQNQVQSNGFFSSEW